MWPWIKNYKWIILLTLLGPLLFNTWLYFNYKEKLESQRAANKYLSNEVAKARIWLKPIKDLSRFKGSLLARMDIVQSVTQRNSEHIDALARLSAVPDGVVLQHVIVRGRELHVSGIAATTVSLKQLVRLINESLLCQPGKIVPTPGKTPGSFAIACYIREAG